MNKSRHRLPTTQQTQKKLIHFSALGFCFFDRYLLGLHRKLLILVPGGYGRNQILDGIDLNHLGLVGYSGSAHLRLRVSQDRPPQRPGHWVHLLRLPFVRYAQHVLKSHRRDLGSHYSTWNQVTRTLMSRACASSSRRWRRWRRRWWPRRPWPIPHSWAPPPHWPPFRASLGASIMELVSISIKISTHRNFIQFRNFLKWILVAATLEVFGANLQNCQQFKNYWFVSDNFFTVKWADSQLHVIQFSSRSC